VTPASGLWARGRHYRPVESTTVQDFAMLAGFGLHTVGHAASAVGAGG